MRYVSASESSKDASLSSHRLVTVGALMERRMAEYVGSPSPSETQHYVLRAATQRFCIDNRTTGKALVVHPGGESFEIHDHAGENAAPPSTLITAPVV
jgi:hypothetical protein